MTLSAILWAAVRRLILAPPIAPIPRAWRAWLAGLALAAWAWAKAMEL